MTAPSPARSIAIRRASQLVCLLSVTSFMILAFQNCAGPNGNSGSDPAATSLPPGESTGVVDLFSPDSNRNPRLQFFSDPWSNQGALASSATNLGCLDFKRSQFQACSPWRVQPTRLAISQTAGSLLAAGLGMVTDAAQLGAFPDSIYGVANLEILALTADRTTGLSKGSLNSISTATGTTAPASLRLYPGLNSDDIAVELHNEGGFQSTAGEQTLQLNQDFQKINGAAPNLGHAILLKARTRISSVQVSYLTNPAQQSLVHASLLTDVLLQYSGAVANGAPPIASLNLEINHGSTSNDLSTVVSCRETSSGVALVIKTSLPGEYFRFDLRPGAVMNPFDVDLNGHLCQALSLPAQPCGSVSFDWNNYPDAGKLKNWNALAYSIGTQSSAAEAATPGSFEPGSALGKVSSTAVFTAINAQQDFSASYQCPSSSSLSSRTFTDAQGQTVLEYCGYPAPKTAGWQSPTASCYQKAVAGHRCQSGLLYLWQCNVHNPGGGWSQDGDDCYQMNTGQTCS
jgi:hypothetical protein